MSSAVWSEPDFFFSPGPNRKHAPPPRFPPSRGGGSLRAMSCSPLCGVRRLGTLEMCIGEERVVRVPPRLGFGSRGSRLYMVPPDAALEYRVRLVSINMQTDPRVRREDVDDEQRFSETPEGEIVNAATLAQ